LAAQEASGQEIWLQARLGEIRCLLRAQETSEAWELARQCEREVQEAHDEREKLMRTADEYLRRHGALQVVGVPLRLPVVLTRLGVVFWEEGYGENAKAFLEKVVDSVPNGASRARQVLAQILLQEGAAEAAERLARESLVFGKFRAKTVASWPLILHARKAQGKEPFDEELYCAFGDVCEGRVACRAALLVSSELRRLGSSRWREIAAEFSDTNDDPVTAFEFKKITLADEKLTTRDHQATSDRAWQLFQNPLATAKEMVSFGKTMVEHGLLARMPVRRIQEAARLIEKRFNAKARELLTHAMALAAMKARKHSLARDLLAAQIAATERGLPAWSKAHWALARMENMLKKHAEAKKHFLAVAEDEKVKPRFRIQAFLLWVDTVKKGGGEVQVQEVSGKLRNVLTGIDDPRILLDAGRQLALAGEAFASLREMVAAEGELKAIAAFRAETDSVQAMVILNHLARRQYYDLDRIAPMLAFWEKLDQAKIDWLWDRSVAFWEYIALIVAGYLDRGDAQGESLAREMLADTATPPLGVAHIGVQYARWLISESRLGEAWELFDRVIEAAPSNRLASVAYYWQALHAHKRGNSSEASRLALLARQCLSPAPTLHWEWTTDARAALLLKQTSDVPADTRTYTENFLERQKKGLASDLKKIS